VLLLLAIVAWWPSVEIPGSTPRTSPAAGVQRSTTAGLLGVRTATATASVVASPSRTRGELARRRSLARPAALPVSRSGARPRGRVAALEESESRRRVADAPRRDRVQAASTVSTVGPVTACRLSTPQTAPPSALRDPGQSAVALRAPPAPIA